tara:strand:+ start:99 stop:1130 length:1032 start_codon:yes stop_codon:yes gene_type:complete
MSYFATLNQFVSNADASRQHAEEFSKQLKDEKINSFDEKIQAHTNDIEKYGGLVQATGTTWHMGRKIMHHIKLMKEKSRGKTSTEEETEEPKKAPTTEDPDYMGLTNEEASELFKPEIHATNTAENQDSALNPSSNKHIEPEKEGAPEGQEASVTNEAPAVEESGADHAEMATSRVMGGRTLEPQEEAPPTQVSETNIDEKSIDEGLEAFKGKSGQLGAKAEEGGEGVSELIDGGANAIKQGIGDTVKQGAKALAKKVGINVGEDVGEGVANAVLDAVPIVGEVVGIATLFGGLFHSMSVKKKEEMKAKAIDATTRAQGQVSGAIDVSAVLGQGAQSSVAGLV